MCTKWKTTFTERPAALYAHVSPPVVFVYSHHHSSKDGILILQQKIIRLQVGYVLCCCNIAIIIHIFFFFSLFLSFSSFLLAFACFARACVFVFGGFSVICSLFSLISVRHPPPSSAHHIISLFRSTSSVQVSTNFHGSWWKLPWKWMEVTTVGGSKSLHCIHQLQLHDHTRWKLSRASISYYV